MIIRILLLLGSLNTLLASEKISYFKPPEKWQDADHTKLSPSVKMAYYKQINALANASINIAVEKIDDIKLSEYLKVVKKIHSDNRSNSWRNLGKFNTKAGKAQLTEITTKNKVGVMKMLQLILVHEGYAYVMTGATQKKHFPTLRNTFVQTFRTLTLTDDLIGEIGEIAKEETLKEYLLKTKKLCSNIDAISEEKKKAILDFHSHVTTNYEEMGAYWQYLIIKELFDSVTSNEIK